MFAEKHEESLPDSLSSSSAERPAWAVPRAPLAPHRLAKLSNALGVSAPLPASNPRSFNRSTSPSGHPALSTTELPRSRAPSAASVSNSHNFAPYSPATSRFLLHIIPPLSLPHDFESKDSDLTPPPSTASGYHQHFRRGTLVPFHSTYQSQLGAIAKEYALPSTVGLMLYLVSGGSKSGLNSSASSLSGLEFQDDGGDGEPGPRLTEAIWRHLWHRVLRVEQDDGFALSSRGATPSNLGLGIALSQENIHDGQGPFKPLVSQVRTETPQPQSGLPAFTPSPSTPSSASVRSRTKSTPLSSSHSEPQTPETSTSSHFGDPESDPRVEAFDLPGLTSSSIIPILAKVEFDIDKRKAAWFEPWIRSRRVNQAKRARSRTGLARKPEDKSTGADEDKKGLLSLALVDGDMEVYARLAEPASAESEKDVGREEDLGEDVTARLSGPSEGFASDANPELSIAGDMNRPLLDDSFGFGQHEEEVFALMDQMGQATLSSSDVPAEAVQSKRHIPPPIVLPPVMNDSMNSLSSYTPGSAGLPYLKEDDATPPIPEYPHRIDVIRAESPVDDKRVGGIYDDIDLGLDEFDDDDPYDRRKSQYLFKARLDEIERNLQQLSPRQLKPDLSFQDTSIRSIVDGRLAAPQEKLVFPPTPTHTDGATSWPAVPYSALSDKASNSSADRPPSPPRFALNGVTTAAPKAYLVNPRSSEEHVSAETEYRRRELAEDDNTTSHVATSSQANSPVIPLSPDPFGRFPSTDRPKPDGRQFRAQDPTSIGHVLAQASVGSREEYSPLDQQTQSSTGRASATPSSRFSADSVTEDDALSKTPKPSLISVKSIKRIWRKSNKSSISGMSATSTVGKNNSMPPPPMPNHVHDGLAAPSNARAHSPSMPPLSSRSRKPSTSTAMPLAPVSPPKHHIKASLDQLHFDQESPYPVRRTPTLQSSPPPKISSRPSISTSRTESTRSPSPPPVTPVERERNSIRKSFLKSWKSASGSVSESVSDGSRSAHRRSSSQSGRSRRNSVLDNVASKHVRGSVVSNLSDIPPSPSIPEQYINQANPTRPGSTSRQPGRLPSGGNPSVDSMSITSPPLKPSLLPSSSPPRSMVSLASSQESEDARSFDASQFEMVSPPKLNGVFGYPYNELDNE